MNLEDEADNDMVRRIMEDHERISGQGSQVSFADPEQALATVLSRQFNLPVEEILAIQPVEGVTLRQQLERMRPRTNVGGLELGTDGRRVTGRVEF